MSRRVGQHGNVFQHSKTWNPKAPAYGRYWIDTPNGRRRRTVRLGACRTRTIARQKLRNHIEREGINTPQVFNINNAPGLTFREQAEKWLAEMAGRRRKPVKPATISGWRYPLDKWALPNLGEVPLADVGNAALKTFIEKMLAAGLSEQTIVTYSKIVKMIVASAVNAEGEQIHPRKWNNDFIGLPIIDPNKQRRPTVTEADICEILTGTRARYAVLFALLAGTGLRIGEALGLKISDLSPDCRVLTVRRSIWGGREQQPKTPSALREVDIAEPLARVLRDYVAGKSGYIFATKNATPIQQRNVLRALHATGKKIGLHAFRRFRTEMLRRARVPEDLIKLWLGHSKGSVTDFYASGLRNDLSWRQEWCDRAGLGFSLLGYIGLQNVVPIESGKVA